MSMAMRLLLYRTVMSKGVERRLAFVFAQFFFFLFFTVCVCGVSTTQTAEKFRTHCHVRSRQLTANKMKFRGREMSVLCLVIRPKMGN